MWTKEFWKAALVRAVRTVAQSALGAIGGTALFGEVNWLAVGSTALLAGVCSLLNALADGKLPEVQN